MDPPDLPPILDPPSQTFLAETLNVGQLSVMLAHIQRGVKHDTGLMLAQRRRRWANNSPALGQRLVFDRLHDRRRERTDTKLTDTKLIGGTNER